MELPSTLLSQRARLREVPSLLPRNRLFRWNKLVMFVLMTMVINIRVMIVIEKYDRADDEAGGVTRHWVALAEC